MTLTLYGIPNCDTVKKARVWLAEQQHDFVFHDFKKQGVPEPQLVGLHLSHVFIGLLLLSTVWLLTFFGKIPKDHHEHIEVVSWYWHFVDAIWLVVVTVVYIISVNY